VSSPGMSAQRVKEKNDPGTPPVSTDRYAVLRAYAATQHQTTVDRLQAAITRLESENRLVSTFTVKEVSGLDYMAYYRNPEALALFRRNSTHLRREREKKHGSRRGKMSKTTGRANTQTPHRTTEKELLHDVPVQPRDRLLNYKKPRPGRRSPKVISSNNAITTCCKNIDASC
jgi:hypothetical protein